MITFSTVRIYCLAAKNAKKDSTHHRGTESTEKNLLLLKAQQAKTIKTSVFSVPLW
jgi:hypothetical protein